MRPRDVLGYGLAALTGSGWRAALIVLAMAIGVGGVITLTWLGAAGRNYVLGELRALGTDLVIVVPGRSETTGAAPPMFGETPRDLTVADSQALLRSPAIRRVAPIVFGTAPVSHGRLDREATVLGTTPDMFDIRHLRLSRGGTWTGDVDRAQPVVVLGATLQRELFGGTAAIGRQVRLGERRFRVIGITASKGESIGLDLDEVAVVPVASAQALFDAPGLFRILVQARDRDALAAAERDCKRILRERHEGEEDVTVITQESVLSTFDEILTVLTLAVGGIASISLVVAAILIMNVMVVAVSQRREEIGLLAALGAPAGSIRNLFLTEAALLSLLGAGLGLLLGQAASWVGHRLYPVVEPWAPWWASGLAVGTALLLGLLFGVAPARRAARLDPVAALSRR